MFTLAFSSNAFKKHSLEEAIRTIARIGYSAVELMADVPHAYPASLSSRERLALKDLLASLKLRVSNINAFTLFAAGDTYHPTFFESDRSRRELRILHTMMAIELAGEVGSKTVSLQPGGPLIGTGLSRVEGGEMFAEGLARLIPCARQHDVTLAIEPEPGLFIESAAEYLEFKARYFKDEPRIAMNCDVGHLFCVNEDPAWIIRGMASEIAHVHLEDIAASRVHQHLPPGRGAMDLGGVLLALAEVKYEGFVTVELYPYVSTAADIAEAAYDQVTRLLADLDR